MLYNKILITE